MSESGACTAFRPLIEDFVDGELGPAERPGLEEHLGVCPDCQARTDFQRRMKSMLKVALSEERTPELLRRRLEKQFVVRPVRPQAPWMRPLLAAAVLLVAMFAGYLLIREGSRPNHWVVAMVSDHTRCWAVQGKAEPTPVDISERCKKWLGAVPPLPELGPSAVNVNGKPCPVDGALGSVHIFYLEGAPKFQLSLYFLRQDDWIREMGTENPAHPVRDLVPAAGKMYQVASWSRGGFIAGLVADMPAEDLDRVAEGVRYGWIRPGQGWAVHDGHGAGAAVAQLLASHPAMAGLRPADGISR